MYFRFEPIREFEKIRRHINDIANDVNKGVSFEMGGLNPRVDIGEDDKNIYFEVELAGVDKKDVKVSVSEDNELSIKGMKKKNTFNDSYCRNRNERNFGEFSRSFQLPNSADRTKIDAKFDNGVLSLTVSKLEPTKPNDYEVTIN